jgi:hypothetical protein
MANISELLNGWGFGKQTAIGTANLVATIWRHTNLNTKPWAKVPVNEDDRAEIGKGHEFPTQLFKSHYNMPAYELSKYASSEFLAWAMSFSMGNVVVSGSGPYTVHHRSGAGSHEPDRPGVALLFVRAADPARWLGGVWTKCWWAAR